MSILYYYSYILYIIKIYQNIKENLIYLVLNHRIIVYTVLILVNLVCSVFLKYDLCIFGSIEVLYYKEKRFSSFLQLRALGASHSAIDYTAMTCKVSSLKEITSIIYHFGGILVILDSLVVVQIYSKKIWTISNNIVIKNFLKKCNLVYKYINLNIISSNITNSIIKTISSVKKYLTVIYYLVFSFIIENVKRLFSHSPIFLSFFVTGGGFNWLGFFTVLFLTVLFITGTWSYKKSHGKTHQASKFTVSPETGHRFKVIPPQQPVQQAPVPAQRFTTSTSINPTPKRDNHFVIRSLNDLDCPAPSLREVLDLREQAEYLQRIFPHESGLRILQVLINRYRDTYIVLNTRFVSIGASEKEVAMIKSYEYIQDIYEQACITRFGFELLVEVVVLSPFICSILLGVFIIIKWTDIRYNLEVYGLNLTLKLYCYRYPVRIIVILSLIIKLLFYIFLFI